LQPFFYFFRTRLHDFNCSDSKTAFQSSKEAIQSRPIFFGHSLPLSRLLLANSVAQLREKPNTRAASAQVMRSDPSPDFFKLIVLRFFLCFLSSGVKIFCYSLKVAYQYLPRLTGHGFPFFLLLLASCDAYSVFRPIRLAASAAVMYSSIIDNTCFFNRLNTIFKHFLSSCLPPCKQKAPLQGADDILSNLFQIQLFFGLFHVNFECINGKLLEKP